MEVVIISSEFPPQPGGIGQQTASLAHWLKKFDNEISIFTNSRGIEFIQVEQEFDCKLPYVVNRAKRFHFTWVTYIQRIFQVLIQLRKGPPKTVISSGKFSLWLGGFFSIIYPRHRYLAILHGSELNLSKWSRKLTMWSLSKFNLAIAVSRYTAQLAKDLQPKLNVTVICNGFEPDRFDSFEAKKVLPGQPALITVGNVTRRKGQQNVIKSLPQILKRYPDVHYHIVGILTEKDAFEALARELDVLEHITFHGPLSDAELTATMRGADIFIMLSERQPNGDVEGFGIAILEANYLGLPAIGSIDSGITDAIKDGYSGKLVQAGQPQNVATVIEEIMEKYAKYSEHSKSWALSFTWNKVIKNYLELLKFPF